MPSSIGASRRPDMPPLLRNGAPHLVLKVLARSERLTCEQIANDPLMAENGIDARRVIKHCIPRLRDIHAIERTESKAWRTTNKGIELLMQTDGTVSRRRRKERPDLEGEPAGRRMHETTTTPWREPYLSDASIHRVGALDFRTAPSRMGDVLVYRDGRVTNLKGREVAA